MANCRWLRPGLFVVPALFLGLSRAYAADAFLPNSFGALLIQRPAEPIGRLFPCWPPYGTVPQTPIGSLFFDFSAATGPDSTKG